MKPDDDMNLQQSQSLFQLQFNKDEQKTNRLDYAKCKEGKPSYQLCFFKDCHSKALLCGDIECICRKDHNNAKFCSFGQLNVIVEMIESKRQSIPELLNWINYQYCELIDQISKQREKIELRVKNYGFSEAQMVFLETIYAGKYEELTGNKVHEAVKDLNLENNKNKQNLRSMQGKFQQKHWYQLFDRLLKEVTALNKLITEMSLKAQETKAERPKSIIEFNSNVAVTEAEKFTVTEMLNSSERRVSQYKLLYRASENEFKVSKFWSKCNHKADTVTLIRTEFDKVIGGYTPLSWKKEKGSCDYGSPQQDSSLQSFLFSVTENTKFILKQSHKQHAIEHDVKYGPIFGQGRDILVHNNANNNRESWARVGCSYENSKVQYQAKEGRQFFQGSIKNQNFKIKEWQVWQVAFEQP